MAKIDESYHELLAKVANNGKWYEDEERKGVMRLQIPSYTLTHNLTESFPALTTKKLAWKSIVGELMWFLMGSTNIKYLVDNNISIWNKDAYNYFKKHMSGENITIEEFIDRVKKGIKTKHYKYGDVGPIYGRQWRAFGGTPFNLEIDQIQDLISKMIEKPMATDHIVTAWDPSSKKEQALPPCHYGFQIICEPLVIAERVNVYCKDDTKTDEMYDHDFLDKMHVPKHGFTLKWNQRSVDVFLGLPFNIASYATLAHIIGKLTNTVPLYLEGNLSAIHIYDNSLEAVREQLDRDSNEFPDIKGFKWDLMDAYCEAYNEFIDDPAVTLDSVVALLSEDINECKLEGYKSYPSIKVKMLERNE